VSTLADMLRDTTDLEPAQSEWLHLLAGDWQLIADLSFADLVLWVRGGAAGWRAVAHVRPNTGPMVFYDDIVGTTSSTARAAMLDEAARTHRLVAKPVTAMHDDVSIREDAVPVVHAGRTIAVVTMALEPHRGAHPQSARADLSQPRGRPHADGGVRGVPLGVGPDRDAPWRAPGW
jgi:hypothetical protein